MSENKRNNRKRMSSRTVTTRKSKVLGTPVFLSIYSWVPKTFDFLFVIVQEL